MERALHGQLTASMVQERVRLAVARRGDVSARTGLATATGIISVGKSVASRRIRRVADPSGDDWCKSERLLANVQEAHDASGRMDGELNRPCGDGPGVVAPGAFRAWNTAVEPRPVSVPSLRVIGTTHARAPCRRAVVTGWTRGRRVGPGDRQGGARIGAGRKGRAGGGGGVRQRVI